MGGWIVATDHTRPRPSHPLLAPMRHSADHAGTQAACGLPGANRQGSERLICSREVGTPSQDRAVVRRAANGQQQRWTPPAAFNTRQRTRNWTSSWLCFALFTPVPRRRQRAQWPGADLVLCCDGSCCSVPETPIFRVLRWVGRVSQDVVVLIPYRRMSGAGSVAGSRVCG